MSLTTNLAFTLPRAPTADPTRWPVPRLPERKAPGTPTSWQQVRAVLATAYRPMSVRELRAATSLKAHNVCAALRDHLPELVRTGDCRWTYRYALRPDER